MDISKAFGSVEHEAVLHALIYQGDDQAYVALIATLHQSRLASVNESRKFSVGKSVRQRDGLSSILLNWVVDVAFQRFKARLLDHGLYIGDPIKHLSNITYAGCIMIFGNALKELTKSICLESCWTSSAKLG